MLKIDTFNHIWPAAFYKALRDLSGPMTDITRRSESVPMMTELGRRFEVMDMFGPDYRQILSLASPAPEKFGTPEEGIRLSRIGTDSMAELCAQYPQRFPGFMASLSMNAPEKLPAEARRAVELGACAIQVYSNVNGKPLDLPEFLPFWKTMAELDRPVFLHPARAADFSDYKTETRSEYEIWWTFGWPYETSAAMARLVFSKVFDECPGLKVVTHHAGGMVPFFEGRVGPGWDQMGARTSDRDLAAVRKSLKKQHLQYFKEFYADTASFGSKKAIEHAIEFFGAERVLFASDAPFDPEGGPYYIRETIRILDSLAVDEATRRAIYQDNAVRILGLTL